MLRAARALHSLRAGDGVKACVFATVVTLGLLGQGMLVGHAVGGWKGSVAAFALGAAEGYATACWFLRRLRSK